MKRFLKITLISLASLIGLIALIALGGWLYLKATFLNFEKGYEPKTDIETVTEGGYSFLDRNGDGSLDVYEDDRNPAEVRVADILSKMTLEEKIHLLKGSGMASALGMIEPGEGIPGVVGHIVPTPRLGLPRINLSDGPAGLRIEPIREGEERTFYTTAFPIGTMLACTWNEQLINEVGQAMGSEAVDYGIDVILGPGANIHRHPFCGRNFEYYSEDPVVTGVIGAAMVNGIESKGVGTSVKHFVANNQESNRNFNNAIVSDRAMREIYLKGFEIIVDKAQPWTIMSSYNKTNGTYVPQSKFLLTDVLRNEWGFEGLVMSDWFGGQDAVAMVAAGNDLLEPGTKRQWKALTNAAEEGTLSIEDIDTAVRRILNLVVSSKKMSGEPYSENPDLKAHGQITRQSAAEGIVLLKNKNTLPLQAGTNAALLGLYSYDFITGGTGSGDVAEAYAISLDEGLENTGFNVNALGKELFIKHREAHKEAFVKYEGLEGIFNQFNPPAITYSDEEYSTLAAGSDVGIITIGRNSGEGGDRKEVDDFLLKANEQEMIEKTCEAFHALDKKVILVLNIGGVVETASWKSKPDAIVLAWQGGQEGGNAVADILSGRVNPSGKLSMTFPVRLTDHASNANFPLDGIPIDFMNAFKADEFIPKEDRVKDIDYTKYDEGIYVGYRHFDKENIDVSYPFGYGLSYTKFEYQDLEIERSNDTIQIRVSVKNIGGTAGKEVVQVYSSMPETNIDRPVQELRAFAKTQALNPETVEELTFSIPVAQLSYWDEASSSWKVESGDYTISLGSSSRELRLSGNVTL